MKFLSGLWRKWMTKRIILVMRNELCNLNLLKLDQVQVWQKQVASLQMRLKCEQKMPATRICRQPYYNQMLLGGASFMTTGELCWFQYAYPLLYNDLTWLACATLILHTHPHNTLHTGGSAICDIPHSWRANAWKRRKITLERTLINFLHSMTTVTSIN